MRRRIMRLAMGLCALAIAVFGLPLATGVTQFLLTDELNQLTKTATGTALAVGDDLTQVTAADLTRSDVDAELAVYDAEGNKVGGVGPDAGTTGVKNALVGATATGISDGRFSVAIPVSDGDSIVGAVLATSPTRSVYVRIALIWSGMVALAAAAMTLSWVLARRQAGRLVGPLRDLSLLSERLGDGDFSIRTAQTGITEIDSLNSSLTRTAERLGALMDRERAFSADASHQLRTPLTGLQLQLESALDQPDADLADAIRAALSTTQRLASTIEELLALARDAPQSPEQVAVADVLAEVHRRWHTSLAAQGRQLRLEADGLIEVSVPLLTVTQVLDVLTANASIHGRGTVTVTIRTTHGAVAFDVADQGPELIDVPFLFGRPPDSSGHGIGLNLARRLAEARGGRLTVSKSAPPTFTLLLPDGAATQEGQIQGPS